jgi:dynactin complex subunit
MKKSGHKKGNLQDTWGNLVNKVANLPSRLVDAVEEGFQEATEQASNLRCAKSGLLDFDLIEEDVKQIHRNLEMKGGRVLKSHVILDDKLDRIEIQTYTEKGDKTYRTINSAKVQEIINAPDEVLAELNRQKRVELAFTPD